MISKSYYQGSDVFDKFIFHYLSSHLWLLDNDLKKNHYYSEQFANESFRHFVNHFCDSLKQTNSKEHFA